MIPIRRLGWTALALAALVGCDSGTTTPPAGSNSATVADHGPSVAPKAPMETKPAPVEPAVKPEEPKKEAAADKLSDEEIAEIKKLSPEDQKIAMEQVICPVSGDKLGAMEKPIKQVVDGKTFFLCCASCEKEVKANPAAVLAKLKK